MASTGVNVCCAPVFLPDSPIRRPLHPRAARCPNQLIYIRDGILTTLSQVLRWSALAGGLFYGFSHQRAITATQKAEHSKHEYEKKQKLIEQAKAEYAKQKNPAPASSDNGAFLRHYFPARSTDDIGEHITPVRHVLTNDLVITDVNSPQFDLEKFLTKVAKENP